MKITRGIKRVTSPTLLAQIRKLKVPVEADVNLKINSTKKVIVDKMSDTCSVCEHNFDVLQSSFFLNTKDISVFCVNCSTLTVVRGALKICH